MKFKFNLHSMIDVITNSSTETFITTDKKIVRFFQDLMSEKQGKAYNYIKIYSYNEYLKDGHEIRHAISRNVSRRVMKNYF
jgi:hypothetical protein